MLLVNVAGISWYPAKEKWYEEFKIDGF